jgi:hypothetical protein
MLGFLRRKPKPPLMTPVMRGTFRDRQLPGGSVRVHHGEDGTMVVVPGADNPRRMTGLLLSGLAVERERVGGALEADEVLWGEWGEGRYTVSIEVRRVAGPATPARAREEFPQLLPGILSVEERSDRIVERAAGELLHQRVYFGAESVCFVLHTAAAAPVALDIKSFKALSSNVTVAVGVSDVTC